MKKIVFAVILGFLVQTIPAKVMASDGPPPPSPTTPLVLLGAAVAGYFLIFEGGSAPSAKKTGNEFVDLNNKSFKNLLNQVAGGSLDTLEIVK